MNHQNISMTQLNRKKYDRASFLGEREFQTSPKKKSLETTYDRLVEINIDKLTGTNPMEEQPNQIKQPHSPIKSAWYKSIPKILSSYVSLPTCSMYGIFILSTLTLYGPVMQGFIFHHTWSIYQIRGTPLFFQAPVASIWYRHPEEEIEGITASRIMKIPGRKNVGTDLRMVVGRCGQEGFDYMAQITRVYMLNTYP